MVPQLEASMEPLQHAKPTPPSSWPTLRPALPLALRHVSFCHVPLLLELLEGSAHPPIRAYPGPGPEPARCGHVVVCDRISFPGKASPQEMATYWKGWLWDRSP